MEMLPPAPSVVVGAAVVKRFPGYGEHRGTIANIDIVAGKAFVHWSTTDERTTLTLNGTARAQGVRPREALVAQAPPRRRSRRHAVAASPPPLGISKTHQTYSTSTAHATPPTRRSQ